MGLCLCRRGAAIHSSCGAHCCSQHSSGPSQHTQAHFAHVAIGIHGLARPTHKSLPITPSQVALLDCSTPGLERRAVLKGPGVDLYSNVEFSADGMVG